MKKIKKNNSIHEIGKLMVKKFNDIHKQDNNTFSIQYISQNETILSIKNRIMDEINKTIHKNEDKIELGQIKLFIHKSNSNKYTGIDLEDKRTIDYYKINHKTLLDLYITDKNGYLTFNIEINPLKSSNNSIDIWVGITIDKPEYKSNDN